MKIKEKNANISNSTKPVKVIMGSENDNNNMVNKKFN